MWISGSLWIQVHNSSSHKNSKQNLIIEVKILSLRINFRISLSDKILFQKLRLIKSHNMSLIKTIVQVEGMGIKSNLILRHTRIHSRSWIKNHLWGKHHLIVMKIIISRIITVNTIDYLNIPRILLGEIFLLQLLRKKGISQWHNLSWWLWKKKEDTKSGSRHYNENCYYKNSSNSRENE